MSTLNAEKNPFVAVGKNEAGEEIDELGLTVAEWSYLKAPISKMKPEQRDIALRINDKRIIGIERLNEQWVKDRAAEIVALHGTPEFDKAMVDCVNNRVRDLVKQTLGEQDETLRDAIVAGFDTGTQNQAAAQ